jgi:glycine betaine/proline transport system substrate-binding protein
MRQHIATCLKRLCSAALAAALIVPMADAMGRYRNGKPIFFYTWTPNWTVGMLKPGKDVVWIGVDHPSLPEDQKQFEDETTVSGVTGCVSDPCPLGWPANDIRPVVNNKFLANNPAARKLFDVVRIPLEDIYAQNAKMFNGDDSEKDLIRHANEWIEQHRDTFEK